MNAATAPAVLRRQHGLASLCKAAGPRAVTHVVADRGHIESCWPWQEGYHDAQHLIYPELPLLAPNTQQGYSHCTTSTVCVCLGGWGVGRQDTQRYNAPAG